MDPDKEIDVDMSPFIIIYKSGRGERLIGAETVPPSVDPATGVVSKDVTIDAGRGISARLFLPQVIISPVDKKKLPILVYYHGGAFCTSSPFTPGYTSYLNSLVSKAKIIAPIECDTTDPEVSGWYKKMWTTVNLAGVDEDHPTQNPLVEGAPSLAGLGCRRAMVCVAGEDVLGVRGRAYYHGLRGSGWRGEAEMKETEGEGHVSHLNKPDSPEAKALMGRVVAFINA